MIKFLMFVFLMAVLLLSGYDWYYHESQHAAFNTGMYFILTIWWTGIVIGESERLRGDKSFIKEG